MQKQNFIVSTLGSIVLPFLASCVFLGGTAHAEVYYMTEDGKDWNAAKWYNYSTGASGTQSTLDSASSYYIGKNPTDTNRARISTAAAFGGQTLYVGINPDGTLPTTSDYVSGASTALITINTNQTLEFADDIRLGNGIIAFTGTAGGDISNAKLTGKTDNAKITVAANATNAVLRDWASNDTRSYTLDIPLTGGEGAKISVYTLNPTKSKYVGTITLSRSSAGYTGSWELTRLSRLDVTAVNALGTGGDVTLGQQATLNVKANQTIGNLKTTDYDSTGTNLNRVLTGITMTEKDTRTVNVAASTTLSATSVTLGAKDSLNLGENAKLSLTGTGTHDATTPIKGSTTTTLESANSGSAVLVVDLNSTGLTNFSGKYQTASGAKMTLKSTTARDVANAVNVGASSTMELENSATEKGELNLDFQGVISGTGTININSAPGTDNYDRRISISNTSNTFSGTWNVKSDSILYVDAANALGDAPSLTMNTNAKLYLTADQEFTTISPINDGTNQTITVSDGVTFSVGTLSLGSTASVALGKNTTFSVTGTGAFNPAAQITYDSTTTFEGANKDSAALVVDLNSDGLTNFAGTYQTASGAKMTLKSTEARDVSNAVNVGANSTMELENYVPKKGVQNLNFNGAISGTGTININTHQSVLSTKDDPQYDRRIYINNDNNTFSGTWNVLEQSFLYTKSEGKYNLGYNEVTKTVEGKQVTTIYRPSLVMAKNSKLIQNSTLEEFENLTINGSGVTMTMVNGVTTKVADTFTVWSDTKINASRDALYLASTNVSNNNKTLYAKNIFLNSSDTATSATLSVGACDLIGNTYTNYNGTLYVGTLGTTAKKLSVTLNSGTIGAYDSTTQITVNGDFTVAGDNTTTHNLVLNVAKDQTGMAVTGFMRLWTDLTLNAPSSVTLTSGKPTQVISFDSYNPTNDGGQTPTGTIVLGSNLSGKKMYIGEKGVYLAKDEDTLHKYYISNGNWARYGMEDETATITDTQGTYYIKQGNGTVDLKDFTGKALYAGYDVATGDISGSKEAPGTTDPTIVIHSMNTALHLGKGGAYVNKGDDNTLNGTVVTEASTDFVIRMNNTDDPSRSLTIESTISGSGSLTFTGRTNTSYKTVSKIYLKGNNSAFTGTMNILNEIPIFADGVNSLGSGTVTMNPTTIYDKGGKNPENVGAARLWVGADQDLKQLTYNMTDAASFVAVNQNATLKLGTLELGADFTFSDRTETFPKYDGTSYFTKDYKAGTIDVTNITKPVVVTTNSLLGASDDTEFNLANGTLKFGTIASGITLNQTGGVVEVSDSATNRLMEIYGDYNKTGGTLQLTFDDEGNDSLYVHGALSLDTLTLFGEDGYMLSESQPLSFLKTDDKDFDLNKVAVMLEGSLQGQSVTFAYDSTTNTWGVRALSSSEIPEPATWVLLLVGIFGSAVIQRVSAFTAFTSGKTARQRICR